MPDGPRKVALITGANRGIGLETARQLGRLGFIVLMGCGDGVKGREAVEKVVAEGIDACFVKLDATKADDREAVAGWIEERYGKLDVLINNAGVALDKHTLPSEVTEKILRETLEINFFAVVALTQRLLPLLRKSEAGRIVNVSSNLGSLTQLNDPESKVFGMTPFAYGASKTAINAFTVYLGGELRGSAIKVNAAHPGWVKTGMGGTRAPLDVADGARTSVRLATLGADGPTGGFYHFDKPLAW